MLKRNMWLAFPIMFFLLCLTAGVVICQLSPYQNLLNQTNEASLDSNLQSPPPYISQYEISKISQPSSLPSTRTPAPSTPIPLTPTPVPTATPAILVGAGDIAICGQDGDDQTADLLDDIPGVVFTAGDNSNEKGTMEQYQECFGPSWGRHLGRIRPSAGNHDYQTVDAEDYFSYFGDAAGKSGEGYYSYEMGDWHIIVLNSNCLSIDGCGPSSPQIAWLKEDLEIHPNLCTLAYWHHPRWSSNFYGDSEWLDTFWQVLYEHRVELIINGHDHYYERLTPQNPDGDIDLEEGIRQIILGTGGVEHAEYYELTKNSEVRNNEDFGVLKLDLFPGHYEWEFIPVAEDGFTDSGSDICH